MRLFTHKGIGHAHQLITGHQDSTSGGGWGSEQRNFLVVAVVIVAAVAADITASGQ